MFAKAGWWFCGFLVVFVGVVQRVDGVPYAQPCPQFLPVAVQLDPQASNIVSLKTLLKINDEQNKKNPVSNLVISLNDDIPNSKKPDPETPQIKPLSDPPLLEIHEISSAKPGLKAGQTTKKRRRARPKEPKKLILNQNALWSLKSINEKPAVEVLMTDKASAARDLKDTTESAIVAVKMLESN